MKRIATHKQPDADALSALYLAERFLFAGDSVSIIFVGRGAVPIIADCVVDVGNEYDPARLRFDHKPPAFPDRNTHCATSLLYAHLRAASPGDTALLSLAAWVGTVHEGDANPPRRPSPALRQSRAEGGFHAFVAHTRRTEKDDSAVCRAVRDWLKQGR